MFGRKKKVDLEELLQELTSDDGNVRSRVKRRVVDDDVEDHEQQPGVKFKVEFEGVEELIKEIRSLRESINELIGLLKEQESTITKK
ncbi:hypothetical protein [Vulcanisaeta distributa]|uniref:Uncharacterized protein n=1 Tax=Vulcanisaeta distributa (strain DSM 14429 / JCM 11212 / NBRC 100878 / IC-017) TaxID=572478 RepID=E1QPA0_VULDI|nr:hypothetical protein [Vulcanisaeta distributa]ADN50271.1 hypothetical protein Vdis_0881 [Vulcanisaeta distributa DSM 14429]